MEGLNNMPPRKLTKSRTNRMIDGVCGGIGEYFGLDPTLVRIVWVLVTLLGGSGFILYILAMIIMPVNKDLSAAQTTTDGTQVAYHEPDRKRFWGITLVLLGGFLIMINLGWFADFSFWSFSHRIIFPLLLIGVGVILIFTYLRRSQSPGPSMAMPGGMAAPELAEPRELRKSRTDRKLFGVCGGIAKYFSVDSTIIRILYIILVLASFGWGLLLYIILGIVMPDEKLSAISS
jgi:phage shock protein C